LMLLKMTTGDPFVNPVNVPDINLVNTLGISLNRNMIFQYLGGPGSVYGIGTTTIPRVVDTTKLRSATAMNYDLLMKQKTNFNNGKPKLQDFRVQLNAQSGLTFPIFPNIWTNEQNVDYRFFVNKKDRMNLLFPFLFRNDQAPWEVTDTKEDTQDLIKFVFEAISNDNPNISTAIFFRAFLTAGITDNNNAELNSFKYIGRGENFFTYQGFNRSIGFSFRVAAQSREELRPLYNKLNMLMGQVYPDYNPNQGFMRAPLVRITLGDYLYRVPGFIESINLTVDNNTPWEINLENNQAGNIAQLPQVVDVAVTFRPILDVLPRRAGTNLVTSQTTNAETEQTTVTDTYTSNVAALIANVPKSSPEDQNTFIKPILTRQFVSSRDATLTELQAVDSQLAADIQSVTPIDTIIPIRPI
jgi:hypothetical protein